MKPSTHPPHISGVEWRRQIRESAAEKILIRQFAKKYRIEIDSMGVPLSRETVGQCPRLNA